MEYKAKTLNLVPVNNSDLKVEYIHTRNNYDNYFSFPLSVVPAVYMALIVPLGFLVGVNDIPSDSHYLYSDNNTLVA